MNLHSLFGRHSPDLKASHWRYGHFVTSCTGCPREMIRLPGQPWRLGDAPRGGGSGYRR
jgi:hypothetical protein